MSIDKSDKVIRKINVNGEQHDIVAKYLGDYTYTDIQHEIKDSCDKVRENILSPVYLYSNPNLDIKDEGNNINCFGYVGLLKNIGVSGDFILIDSISVYIRENKVSPNSSTPVWCRLLKFVNDSWQIVYQSTESKKVEGIFPETLFSFKMMPVDDTNDENKLIRTTDKISIVYVDAVDAPILSGVELGFKSISKPGGLQNVLSNSSGGNGSWCPAFVIGYLSTNPEQTFDGDIHIKNKTTVTTNIDSGELKVRHYGTEKGFIIRTNNKGENENANIFPLEILTTNNLQSYQYNFPKTGGTIPLNVKINDAIHIADIGDGTIDLGNEYLTPENINDKVLFENFEEVTYVELLNLINTCSLVKGRDYRIIDYITTTTQIDTQSAGKPFDVIVTALSNNTLDENAKVCHPKGIRKTYGGAIYGITDVIKSTFETPYNWTEIPLDKKLKKVIYDYEGANNNIIQNEYKIVRDGYSINASVGALNIKFAPRENDVRVVGVEICDVNNRNNVIDCDYHLSDVSTNNIGFSGNYYVYVPSNGDYFVRIIFIKPTSSSSKVNVEIQNYSGHYFNENDLSKWVIKYDIHNDTNKYLWADATNGKGVIYYMKDEFDNECPYDFKNIKFKRTKQWVDDNNLREPNDELKFSEDEKYFYTFDWNGTDDSLCKGQYKCEQNKIEKLLSGKQQQLNNNIFLGNGNANNKIGANSKNNVIGVDSYNNEFGVNFQNNIILHKFTYNTIGNGFQNNVCRGTFRYNNISHLVSGNKFISSFNYNTVSENVKNNTFSGTTQYNTIGAIVQNNDFGGMMYYCNIGANLLYCNPIGFPDLYCVTIDPGILVGTEESPIYISYIYIDGKPLTEAIVNKNIDGNWSNIGITLFKDNDDCYYIKRDNGVVNFILNTTYEKLVDLRNGSQLVPGMKYRITDYVTTTSQPNTQSAGYQFDIIVEALSENTLSEDAKAIQNENDGYFDEANLEAWELKYCLDNDSSRFAWADPENGKGVIYYMKDEFNNECPYDFKNIQFVRYKLNPPTVGGYNYEWQNKLSENVNKMFENNQLSYIWHAFDSSVHYWDTFRDVFSTRTEETKAFYTFSNVINDEISDKSLTNVCYSNVIKESYIKGVLRLNNNIFFSENINFNCHSNSFGNNCNYNSFGDSCHSNSFGDSCHSNSFGNSCYTNSFGNNCYSNSFGDSCYHNSFSNSCYSNSFGNSCESNSFGNSCYFNSFGNFCHYNSFGNNCDYNGFYDDSSYSYNEGIYKYVSDGERLNYVQYVTLNEGCHYLLFHTSEVINEKNKVQNITVTKGVKSIKTNYDGFNIPLLLEIPVTNNEYELKIARNIKGDIKIYCEADLIL